MIRMEREHAREKIQRERKEWQGFGLLVGGSRRTLTQRTSLIGNVLPSVQYEKMEK